MKNKILLLTAIFAAGLIASATAADRGNGQGRGPNADGLGPNGTPGNCPHYSADCPVRNQRVRAHRTRTPKGRSPKDTTSTQANPSVAPAR
jgi:hypothetical protein